MVADSVEIPAQGQQGRGSRYKEPPTAQGLWRGRDWEVSAAWTAEGSRS